MNINRHNYEEFFLLLADGELGEAEQEMVLQFAKQHPDLEEELGLLMDCRLEADISPVFPKEKLLKPIIWDVDAPDEMQSKLLDLLDNELPPQEKMALELQIAADKGLEMEWQTLKQHGKLEVEPAPVFPKEKILKPTIWNVEEPDTVFVQMLDLLDNELPADNKMELEQKIAADKGLQVEWDALQKHGKLQPEAAPAFPKEKILKPTIWNVENPEAVQLQMLALLDNELSGTEKVQLEQQIAANAGLQIEWISLQKAKLVAEAVVYPNKEDLYKEKERRRIGAWLGWAAAAMLLGFGLYMMIPKSAGTKTGTGPEMANKNKADNKSNPSIQKNQPIEQKATDATKDFASNEQTHTQEEAIKNNTSNNSSNTTNAAVTDPITKSSTNTNASTNTLAQHVTNGNPNTRTSKSRPSVLQNQTNGNDLSDGTNNQNTTLASIDPNEDRQTPMLKRTITGNVVDEPSHQVEPKRLNMNTLAANAAHSNEMFRTASYSTTGDENAEDEIVYVAGARINKQKVRGIFRGITRSLGRSFTKSKVEQASPTTGLSRTLQP